MNNFVTILDFTGRYALPDQGFAIDNFNALITDLQYELLINVLGIDLYTDLETNPTDQKWIDFITGAIFIDYTGCNQKYLGIKSVLVPFIYSIFVESNQNQVLNTATVKANNQNSTITNIFDLLKIVYKSWNSFIEKYYFLYAFLDANCSNYPDFENYFKRRTKKGFIEKYSLN